MSKSRARLLAELLNASGRVKKDKSDLAGADSIIDLDTLPTITNAKLENSSISIAGHSTALGGSVSLNTGDITEHTDYKYYTDARVRAAISVDGSLSYNSSTGVLSYTTPSTIASLSNHDTADLAEGTNLYYTDARARGAISVSGNALSYNSSTGVISSSYEENPVFTTGVSIEQPSPIFTLKDTTDDDDHHIYFKNSVGSVVYAIETQNATSGDALTLYSASQEIVQRIGTTNIFESHANIVKSLKNFDVTGNITVSGTVDGRDIASDGSKLDGIESGATADQTQSDINALGITATGLSGTPNITVGSVTGTYFLASGADTTPAGTTFANAFNGSTRVAYFDGDTTTSVWWGSGNTPYAAVDATNGVLKLYVNDTGGNWHQKIGMTSSGVTHYGSVTSTGVINKIDSGSYATFEADGNTNEWKWLRLSTNGTTAWDIAARNDDLSNALQFRPGGGSTNRTYMDTSGNWVMQGSVEVNSHELRVTSSNAYHTHFNYQNNGSNFISQANNGITQFRNSSSALMEIAASGDVTISNDLTVSGNLTVQGTTTTLNTATLDVEDKNITLNYGTGDTSGSADGAGITIQDAVNGSTDATMTWNAASDHFRFSHKVDVQGDLQAYNIYAQDYHVLNSAANGWHEWATRASDKVNLDVNISKSAQIHNTSQIYLGSTATAADQLAVNNGTDIFLGTTSKGLRTYKDLHTNAGNNKYWHAGNDGASSGLDADTLDGIHGDAFLRSNANDVATGRITLQYGVTSDFNSVGGTQGVTAFYAANVGQVSNRPDSGNYATGLEFVYHDTSARSQLAAGSGGSNNTAAFYVRSEAWGATNSWTSWYKLFHTGNDGSGSGLDADTVDGIQGSQFLRSDAGDTHTGGTITLGSGSSIDASSNDRYLSFRVIRNAGTANLDGMYIGYSNSNSGHTRLFGGGATSGGLYIRGSGANDLTYGNNTGVIWHSANDGAGSGLDADTVDSLHASSFLRSDAADTATGNLTFTGNISQTGGTFLSHGAQVSSLTTAWQAAGTSKDRGLYPFRFQNGATGQPESGDNAHWGLNIYAHGGSSGNYPYGTQLSAGSTQTLWHRWWANGSASAWRKIWDSSNDGASSGLDADTVDGIHGASFLRSDTSDSWNSLLTYNGSNNGLEVGGIRGTALGSQTGDFIHLYERVNIGYPSGWGASGAAAPAYGLSTWGGAQINIGNVSSAPFTFNGNNVWHAGNDGTGSGLDADTVDGVQASSIVYGSSARKTNNSNPNSAINSGFYDVYQTNAPTSTWYSYITMAHTNTANQHGHQIAGSFYSDGELFNRHYDGTTASFGNWTKIWNAANDGSGSGLDADYVDGIQGSQFLRSDAGDTATGNIVFSAATQYFRKNDATNYTNGSLMVESYGGASSIAAMGFHISGQLGRMLSMNSAGTLNWEDDVSISGSFLTPNTSGNGLRSANGANFFYPLDAYNNMHIRSTTGSEYHDSTAYYFRKVDQSNLVTITSSNTNIAAGTLTRAGNTVWDAGNDGSGSGLDADLLDGIQRSDLDHAEGFKTWSGINASAAQAKRYHIGRLYGCPAHWDGNWQNIEFHITAESYESGTLKYRVHGDYGGAGTQANMLKLILTEVTGPMSHRFRLLLGSPVDAGWDYSGADTFYMDLYAEAAYYSQWKVNAKTYGHPYQTSNPTSGGAVTVFYSSPTASNVSDFNITHTQSTIRLDTSGNQVQTAQTRLRAHSNGWAGGLALISEDASDTFQIHPDNNGYMYVDKNWYFTGDVHIGSIGTTAITTANIGSQSVSSASNIDGVGFTNTGSNSGTNANTIDSNGISYYTSGVDNFSGNATDGALFSQRYSSNWQHQIAGDYRSGQIALRGKNNGTWQSWRKVWDASNDGSGSTLDADLLDGKHKAYFEMPPSPLTQNGNMNNVSAPAGQYASVQFYNMYTPSGSGNQANYNVPEDAGSHYHVQQFNGYSNSYNNWKYQIAHSFYNGRMYHRNQYDTTWQSWAKVWDSDSDGANSGLDADTLDGQHASAFLGATAKAADSNLLDGLDSTDYRQYTWRSFTVGGDLDKFYPALFSVGNGNHGSSDLEIAQSNVHQNGSSHGAFYARFGLNITGWGHVPQMRTLREYTKSGNTYISKIADTDHATGQIGIWLRGSTTYYYRCSDGAIFDSVRCTDNQPFTSYDHSNNAYDITITHATTVEDAIFNDSMHTGKVVMTSNIGNYAWTSANDGSGSGLDADLLDGNHGSAFVKSGAGASVSGWWINQARNGYNSGSNMPSIYMSHSSGYGLHINSYNTSGSIYNLECHNNSAQLFAVYNDGDIQVGGNNFVNSSRQVTCYSVVASDNITAYSDERLKENIEVIPNALEKVEHIRGVTFTRNDQEDKEKIHSGVIAQEVERVLPEVVDTDEEGIKSVAYGNMIGLLIEAVKELKQEVDDLKAQLKEK